MNSRMQRLSKNTESVDLTDKVSIQISNSPSRRVFGSSDLWTVFSPHTETEHVPAQELQPSPSPRTVSKNNSKSPEQRLALVAFRLAVFEKLATALGKLAFVWATVVLLGGFVNDLKTQDFWTISVLLLTEGTRVFSRSRELEWQQANYSLGILHLSSFIIDKSSRILSHSDHQDAAVTPTSKKPKNIYQGFGAKRTWSLGNIPFVPYASTRAISFLLYLLQLLSAGVSVGFSIFRLVKHDFEGKNATPALILFYSMMLAEASLFLFERGYWEFKLRFQRLLERVTKKCELDTDNIGMLKHYYYAVYSRCLNESVFQGLDLDLIEFSLQKLQSGIREEQLGSVQVLATLVCKGVSREETRRRIGTTPGAIERLLEMISWKDLSQKEIRKASTLVIRSLVRHHSNCFRISAVPGSLEGIVSLLVGENEDEKECGLAILKELAKDHRTCVRIGNTSGLVSILVSFIRLGDSKDFWRKSTWKLFKRSLQLLKMMSDEGGESGHFLRKKIASMVFALKNLQQITEAEAPKCDLQALAVDILTCLATEDDLRDCIGATGGVIRSLLAIFMKEVPEDKQEFLIRMRAGEAISLLVLQNSRNCSRILKHKSYKSSHEVSESLKGLIKLLNRSYIEIHAATILRSLCSELNDEEKLEIDAAVPRILEMVLESTGKEQEAAIGLTATVIPLLEERSFQAKFSERLRLVGKITELLSRVPPASQNKTRRYSVELLNALMVKDKLYLREFRKYGRIESCLEAMLDNVSDAENFYTFSGVVGLTRHSIGLEELINLALFNLNHIEE